MTSWSLRGEYQLLTFMFFGRLDCEFGALPSVQLAVREYQESKLENGLGEDLDILLTWMCLSGWRPCCLLVGCLDLTTS